MMTYYKGVLCKVMLPQTEHLKMGHVVQSFNSFWCNCYFKVSTNVVPPWEHMVFIEYCLYRLVPTDISHTY